MTPRYIHLNIATIARINAFEKRAETTMRPGGNHDFFWVRHAASKLRDCVDQPLDVFGP
jgi:hypothetical protein